MSRDQSMNGDESLRGVRCIFYRSLLQVVAPDLELLCIFTDRVMNGNKDRTKITYLTSLRSHGKDCSR